MQLSHHEIINEKFFFFLCLARDRLNILHLAETNHFEVSSVFMEQLAMVAWLHFESFSSLPICFCSLYLIDVSGLKKGKRQF